MERPLPAVSSRPPLPEDPLPEPRPDAPTVGVVVPVHAGERWLAEALASVRAQSWERWVCVVVDDASPDRSAAVAEEVAASDARVTVLRLPRRGGVSAARNAGLGRLPVAVTHVALLDGDDVWEPHALATLLRAATARPGLVGASASAELCDEAGAPLLPGTHRERLRQRPTVRHGRLAVLPPTADTDATSLAVAGRIWPPAVALLRRDVVDRVGGFAEDLLLSEDWHFFARAARQGPLAFVDVVVARYRRHPGSATAAAHHDVVHHNDVVRRRLYDEAGSAAERRVAVAAWRAVQGAALARSVRLLLDQVRARRWPAARWQARPVRELSRTLLRRSPPVPDRARAHLRTAMVEVVQPAALAHRRRARTSS